MNKWGIRGEMRGWSCIPVSKETSFPIFILWFSGLCPSINLLGGLGLTEDMISHTVFLFYPFLGRSITLENIKKQIWKLISGLTGGTWCSSSFLFLLSQSQIQTFAHILLYSKTRSQTRGKWDIGSRKIFFHISLLCSLSVECEL